MSATTDIVSIVVVIMGVGVVAQVLADRLRIPSVLFLIVAGVVVGPEGLELVDPDIFGDALPAIVGLSVAIIVFVRWSMASLRSTAIREQPPTTDVSFRPRIRLP